jgi:methyl-accepting chemotaxis protein
MGLRQWQKGILMTKEKNTGLKIGYLINFCSSLLLVVLILVLYFKYNDYLGSMALIIGLLVAVANCILTGRMTINQRSVMFKRLLEQIQMNNSDAFFAKGKYGKGMAEIAELGNKIIQNRNESADFAKLLAAGNFNIKLKSEFSDNVLTENLLKLQHELIGVCKEQNALNEAVAAGQLDYRSDNGHLHGSFSDFVEKQNIIMDSIVMPFKMNANHFNMIANGQIPEKSFDEVPGDYKMMQEDLNACVDGLNALQEGNRVLSLMAVNDFSQCVELESKGIYKDTIDAINALFSAFNFIVGTINLIADGDMNNLVYLYEAGKQSENDQIVPSLITLMENINSLVKETENLTQSATMGDLDIRGQVDQYHGEYGKIIAGFNSTLDAITKPIKEASQVLNELSNGNLNVQMTGDYQGDNDRIKRDMNSLVFILNQYINEITKSLEEISKGNLDFEITSEYLGDFQSIKSSINKILDSLNTMMSEIDLSAVQVKIGATQISQGGMSLSMGANEQNDAIQELSTYMNEIAEKTDHNALDAKEASNLANNARNNAEESNLQMSAMIDAMSEINESSNNISKIIKVIDEIAFQTNILALNAAVEAARAGEHGKGFAVVAEEVRVLASKSARAANETTVLIEGSVEKVTVGNQIADQTAKSLAEISAQIEKVNVIAGKMSKSSNAQAKDFSEIIKIIEQITKVVQNNTQTAEESAASSQELSGQAEMLKQMVETFRIKQND